MVANVGEFYTILSTYSTSITALGPSSNGSPNLLQDLELWEKFESNLLVCKSQKRTAIHNKIYKTNFLFRFIAPSLALQANTTANVGFCMEIEPNVPWDTCIQNTTDPDILDLTTCFEDENYSGHCYDGTLDITKCMKNAPVIMSSPHFYQVN